jgi:hypothetical protein
MDEFEECIEEFREEEEFIDDYQPSEMDEWLDFDPDC